MRLDERETILIRISGPDQTGITSSVMAVLARAEASIQDVEQIVVRGRLTLEVVVDVPPGQDVLKDVLLIGWERNLDIDFEVVESIPVPSLPSLCLLYTSPSPRDKRQSRMPSSA